MTLDVKTQNGDAKTYEIEAYDLTFGNVEDILGILEGAEGKDSKEMSEMIRANWDKLSRLVLEVFPEMTPDELRTVKFRDLIRFFAELFIYVGSTFKDQKN